MSIEELSFPLWVLVHRGESTWRPVTLVPGLAVAFSSHAGAGAFLREADNPGWEVRLVARVTCPAVLGDFRRQGASGLALDPSLEGGGTPIPFENAGAA